MPTLEPHRTQEKTRPHYGRTIAIGAALALVVIPGCGGPAEREPATATSTVKRWPATDVYEVPDQIRNVTMVWSAEPGIDLHSPEATVIRAGEESDTIATLIGFDYTYLGFPESSTIKGGGGYVSSEYFDDTERGPFAGTVHAHMMEIIPTATGFDYVGCLLSVGLDELRNGKYSPSRLANGQGGEVRSRYTRAGPTPTSARPQPSTTPAPGPDRLHWQAPVGNEFTGWTVTTFVDRDIANSEADRCTPWAQSLFPGTPPVIARDAYARENPPPTQPVYPGWPTAHL